MNTSATSLPPVCIAAVGDLLFSRAGSGSAYCRSPELVSPQVRGLFQQCSLVFGNLECTLAGDGRHVPTEPRVVAPAELVRAVKAAGFGVVSLANNHAFDCLAGGFQNMRRLLDEIGLPHFGAGMDLAEAAAPALLDVGGLKIAFLGAADQRSGTQHFAGAGQWGVAPLEVGRLVRHIHDLRCQVDHVLVSLHWGEERFLIPSPIQINQARALVDAGASMVIGHHPHVLQGMELHSAAPILYSLGNFIVDEVPFTDGDVLSWNRTARTGCIVLAELGPQGVGNVRLVPTYDSGQSVELDESGFGSKRLQRAHRALARGITLPRYRREHLWVKTVKPALAYLRWRRLKNLRMRQIRSAIRLMLRSRTAD